MTSEGTGQIAVPSSSPSLSSSSLSPSVSSSSPPSASSAPPSTNAPPLLGIDGLPPLSFTPQSIKLKSLLECNSIVEVMEALETLLIYTKNLILYPEEKKYRKIKITNIHYQERLGHLSGAMDAMEAIGYIPVGEYLRLDEQRMKKENRMNEAVLKEIEVFILNRLQDIKKHWGSMPLKLANSHSYTSVQGAAVYSAIGKRHNMEDDEIIVDNFCGEAGQGYFGLYDGHGGRATVDFVVKALHMNLEQQMKKNPAITLAEAFRNSYLATDGQLRRQNILRSGSTSVTCVIRYVNGKRMLFTANVGDSRAILCRGGKGVRLTIDHKASLPEEAKRITEAGGFIGRNKRVNGVLAITRALGDHMLKENDVVTADPYCSDTELTSEDSLIILACDGVWDVMTDQEACDFTLEKVKYYRSKYEEKLKKDAAAKKEVSGAVHTEEKNSSEMNGNTKKNEDLLAPTGSDDGEKGDDATSPSSSASFAKFAGYPDWGAVEEDTEIPTNLNEVLFYASKALVREALERRSLDNITVMLILL